MDIPICIHLKIYYRFKLVCFKDLLLRSDPKWSSKIEVLWSLSRLLLNSNEVPPSFMPCPNTLRVEKCQTTTLQSQNIFMWPFSKIYMTHDRLISEEKDKCVCTNTINTELLRVTREHKFLMKDIYNTHFKSQNGTMESTLGVFIWSDRHVLSTTAQRERSTFVVLFACMIIKRIEKATVKLF